MSPGEIGGMAGSAPGDKPFAVQTIVGDALTLPSSTPSPWQGFAIARPPTLRLPVGLSRPAVQSVELLQSRPRVQSHFFARAATPVVTRVDRSASVRPRSQPRSGAPRTRIGPPRDVVKPTERFFYLLQPDLDTMLRGCRLAFPRKPFPFQLEGMAFLLPRHAAVLADEMGLGKSMQAISSIRLLVRSGEAQRVLVVCPKGLVSNWARELADWAPELCVAAIDGDPSRRKWQWTLPDVPVKLANYEVLVRDRDLVAELGLSFDLVVLDEAQRIKNKSSQTNRAVVSVSRRRSWALTGTPIENSSDDLVGLFEFVDPGQVHERMQPKAMGEACKDHILRRTKDKVLTEMPPRLDRDARIELGPEQRETYRQAEENGVLRLSGLGRQATIQHVFELVLRLKQICNFDTATGESSKLERLVAELEEVQASGRKALVFSQWVETLGRLRDKLAPFGALEYHGGMTTTARDEAIRRFKECREHSVLLLSYGAGAVGLNLQFSQYVFLFDRWWNPAIEDQAINRAHRIGAAGAVTVTRFLSVDTIEERIDEVLRQKRDLSEAILAQADGPTSAGLTAEELFKLFELPLPQRAAA